MAYNDQYAFKPPGYPDTPLTRIVFGLPPGRDTFKMSREVIDYIARLAEIAENEASRSTDDRVRTQLDGALANMHAAREILGALIEIRVRGDGAMEPRNVMP